MKSGDFMFSSIVLSVLAEHLKQQGLSTLAKRKPISFELKVFFTTFFVCHVIIIALTIVDWDGRFLLPILPVLFILGGRGYGRMLNKMSSFKLS